jgi:hypothetical protein
MSRRSSARSTSYSARSTADRSPRCCPNGRFGDKHVTETLAEKTCTHRRDGVPPLARDEALRFQAQAPDWELRDDAHRFETDALTPDTIFTSRHPGSWLFIGTVGETSPSDCGQCPVDRRSNPVVHEDRRERSAHWSRGFPCGRPPVPADRKATISFDTDDREPDSASAGTRIGHGGRRSPV